jgi:hypothetical protein
VRRHRRQSHAPALEHLAPWSLVRKCRSQIRGDTESSADRGLGLSDVVIHSNHPAATGAAGLGAETMSCADIRFDRIRAMLWQFSGDGTRKGTTAGS